MKSLFLADECVCCGSRALATSPAVLMPFVARRVFGHEPLEITSDWGLRDLRPGTAYTLCNSLLCHRCGTLFLDYRFSDEQMAALYRGYRDASYTRQRDFYEPGYADSVALDYLRRHAYLERVESWLAPRLPKLPAVLDWGGGDGANSPFLGSASPLHVLDISGAQPVAGAEVVDPSSIGGQHYDLVVCSQVLEHVSSPLALLESMLRALSASTLLYLEVPHEALIRAHPGDPGLAACKRHWHEHINFFTEEGLRRLAGRARLDVLDILRLPIDNGARQGEVMGLLCRTDAPP